MGTEQERIHWIDRFKGIGMLLVMIGHTRCSADVIAWIYTFHVPLFFFSSGYLFDSSRFPSAGAWVKSRIRTLGVPYLFFGIVGFGLPYLQIGGLDWLERGRGLRDAIRAIGGLLLGMRDTSPFNGTLWFVSCLAATEGLHFMLIKTFAGRPFARGAIVTGVSLAASWGLGKPSFRIPFSLDIACVCLLFHWAGSTYRRQGRTAEAVEGWPSLILLGTASILFSRLVPMPNLYYGRSGNPLLFHLMAMTGIFFVLAVARKLPDSSLLSHIGKSSLSYLALHQWLIFPITSRLLSSLGPVPDGWIGTAGRTSILILAALITIGPLSLFLERFLPALVGKRRSREAASRHS